MANNKLNKLSYVQYLWTIWTRCTRNTLRSLKTVWTQLSSLTRISTFTLVIRRIHVSLKHLIFDKLFKEVLPTLGPICPTAPSSPGIPLEKVKQNDELSCN